MKDILFMLIKQKQNGKEKRGFMLKVFVYSSKIRGPRDAVTPELHYYI